ncbi:MAG: hypothetical protein MHM6MM_001549 [Cercozoa sp. M6MM]
MVCMQVGLATQLLAADRSRKPLRKRAASMGAASTSNFKLQTENALQMGLPRRVLRRSQPNATEAALQEGAPVDSTQTVQPGGQQDTRRVSRRKSLLTTTVKATGSRKAKGSTLSIPSQQARTPPRETPPQRSRFSGPSQPAITQSIAAARLHTRHTQAPAPHAIGVTRTVPTQSRFRSVTRAVSRRVSVLGKHSRGKKDGGTDEEQQREVPPAKRRRTMPSIRRVDSKHSQQQQQQQQQQRPQQQQTRRLTVWERLSRDTRAWAARRLTASALPPQTAALAVSKPLVSKPSFSKAPASKAVTLKAPTMPKTPTLKVPTSKGPAFKSPARRPRQTEPARRQRKPKQLTVPKTPDFVRRNRQRRSAVAAAELPAPWPVHPASMRRRSHRPVANSLQRHEQKTQQQHRTRPQLTVPKTPSFGGPKQLRPPEQSVRGRPTPPPAPFRARSVPRHLFDNDNVWRPQHRAAPLTVPRTPNFAKPKSSRRKKCALATKPLE